eukprot:tig00021462_g21578.t1
MSDDERTGNSGDENYNDGEGEMRMETASSSEKDNGGDAEASGAATDAEGDSMMDDRAESSAMADVDGDGGNVSGNENARSASASPSEGVGADQTAVVDMEDTDGASSAPEHPSKRRTDGPQEMPAELKRMRTLREGGDSDGEADEPAAGSSSGGVESGGGAGPSAVPGPSTGAGPSSGAGPSAGPSSSHPAPAEPAEEQEPQLSHVSRDEIVRGMEERGAVTFECITNDDTDDNLIKLTDLKNIFSKQLPKMPRDYILRLVFDRKHWSMLIKKQERVIGGITFRPTRSHDGVTHFAEIAFCAITSSEQVRGFGTRLMNHFKDYARRAGITHALTYADNDAIGYFEKQGFTKTITLEKDKWFGYIKDYDGGTLMECVIYKCIDYLDIAGMVRKQRAALFEKLRRMNRAPTVYSGRALFADGATSVPVDKIEGLPPGYVPKSQRAPANEQASGDMRDDLKKLLYSLQHHSAAWPFLAPVNPDEVEDYYKVIKDPIDLSAIERKVNSTGPDQYRSREAFALDVQRMLRNCRIYNDRETRYYKCADDLERFFNAKYRAFFKALPPGVSPAPRSSAA